MSGDPTTADSFVLADFDPRWEAFRTNPYPFYRRLREESPVHRIASTGAYWVTRHDLARQVLQDPRLSAHSRGADPASLSMLNANPPDHTRLRALVNQAFTPRRVEQLRPKIGELAAQLIGRVRPTGQMDVVADFAFPLPAMVIAELLGVPWEDRDRFADWSRRVILGTDAYQPKEVLEDAQTANQELLGYFSDLIRQRRTQPRQHDMISELMAAEEDGARLSGAELLQMCFLLLLAGHETTSSLIANGTLALLRNPDQLELLRSRPDLMESAVEELLRFDPPVQRRARHVFEAYEIGGVAVPAGVQILAVIGAANRDAAVFDAPERLDITRAENPHLSFGRGIHFCLGASLARMEGAIAFTALLGLKDLELAEPGEPRWAGVTTFRRLERLAVRFA